MNTATLTLSDINCIVIHDTYMLYDAIIWCPLEVLRCSRVFNATLNGRYNKGTFCNKKYSFLVFSAPPKPQKVQKYFLVSPIFHSWCECECFKSDEVISLNSGGTESTGLKS